jgi:hypothetical protein
MHRALVALALASVGALVAGPTAAAQAPAATMTGEFLSSVFPAAADGNCDREGTSTYAFEVSGVAAGPYPGTFTETGSFTIGPHDVEFFPGQFGGRLTAFQAAFTIVGPAGTVRGTKTLAPGGTRGACNQLTPDFSSGQIEAFERADNPFGVTYEATITLPDGRTFTDRGRSQVGMNFCDGSGIAGTCSGDPSPNAQFREFFQSDLLEPEPAPQCSDLQDNDGDGLIDFPADPGCESPTDDSESPDPPPPPQCSDLEDNDGDGLIDFPADPGCESPTDDSESPNPPPPPTGCPGDDGRDDDEDDDGLRDRSESLFGSLLNDRDSDDDGVVDGNEDSDNDGEDDEDEDDDDDCPDDEDGDGTDDEDEDDEQDDD